MLSCQGTEPAGEFIQCFKRLRSVLPSRLTLTLNTRTMVQHDSPASGGHVSTLQYQVLVSVRTGQKVVLHLQISYSYLIVQNYTCFNDEAGGWWSID